MRGFRNVLRVLGILVVLGAMGLIVSALVLILDGQDASGIETVQATKGLGRFFWAGIVASIGLTLLLTSFLDQAARTRSPSPPSSHRSSFFVFVRFPPIPTAGGTKRRLCPECSVPATLTAWTTRERLVSMPTAAAVIRRSRSGIPRRCRSG